MDGGRFSLERKLGAGATGVVYAAWDRVRGTHVALKTLRQLDADALYRLKREFRSLADVTHPNLVEVYELVSVDEKWFLTMELVEGGTFLDHVRAGGTLDVGRLRDALAQLATGVHALHESGHLHRDLKPSNVLVATSGRVAICDFGLVTEVPERRLRHTIEDSVAGTLAYLSPEHAALMPLTEASDWYSVGVILYEALTGRLPFDGSRREVLARKQMLEPIPPSAVNEAVPSDLDWLCRELLAIDPPRRPRGEDVLMRLGAGRLAASVVPVFIGRTAELAMLDAALVASAEKPTAVVLHGEPGAGKSALARRFLRRLGGDALVLSARCSERASVPYNAIDELLDEVSVYLAQLPDDVAAPCVEGVGALARLFPVLERVPALSERLHWELGGRAPDPVALRAEAFDAFRTLLGRLARRARLVIWIDDLMWSDQDSLALLSHTFRSDHAPPVLLIATARDGAPRLPHILATLSAGIEVRRCAVGGLADVESRLLATTLLPDVPHSTTEMIARESRGNPLFAHQLAGYLESGESALPGLTLELLLSNRLDRLPAPSRHLLEAVALGGDLPRKVVVDAARLARDTETRSMAELRMARLLRVSGSGGAERVSCFHDRINDIVLAQLSPGDQEQLHGRIATALVRSDHADPESLLRHFRGARNDERASRYANEAADAAAHALAFDRAVRLYELARELGKWNESELRTLDEKLANALCNAGRGTDAARCLLALAAKSAGKEALTFRRRAADQLLRSGKFVEGVDVARDVLADVGLRLPSSPRRALLSLALRRVELAVRGLSPSKRDPNTRDVARLEVCWAMAIGLGLVDVPYGLYFHTLHLRMALDSGERDRVLRGLALEVCQRSAAGTRDAVRVRRLLDRVESLAVRVDTPEAHAWSAAAGGANATLSGRFREGLAQCDRAAMRFRRECTGVFWESSSMELFSLWCLYALGSFRELAHRVPRLLEQADERGDAFSATNLRTGFPAIRWIVADAPAMGREEVESAMRNWVRGPFHMQHYYELVAHASLDIYERHFSRAWSRLEACWPTLRRSGWFLIQNARIELRAMRGRLALELGDSKRALRDAAALETEGTNWARGASALLVAGAARRDRDDDASLVALTRASACFADAGMTLHQQAANWMRGELVGGEQGRELRTSAVAWAHEQGARNAEKLIAMWTMGFNER